MREWFAAWISRWVARPNELNALKLDPRLVGNTIEAAVFHHLAKE
jgi:hypothetical protein